MWQRESRRRASCSPRRDWRRRNPSHRATPTQTIGLLEAEGYDVIIDRVGSAPIERVHRHQRSQPTDAVTRTFWVGEGKDRELVTVVVSRSITVSLNCDV